MRSEGSTGSTWEDLAPGVARLRLPGWDETVGAVAGDDGLLLVDAGASTATAAELARGRRVRRVVVTHPHFDHALGAGAFPGAEVYGELPPGGAAELVEDGLRHGLDREAAEEGAAALGRLGPWRPVGDGEEVALDLGGGRRAALLGLGAAHSPADVAVRVRVPGAAPVVFCGDLVEESGEPQAGPDASPARWPAALDRLLAWGGPDAVYVPGHGAVVDAAFVRSQRDTLARRFGRVVE
jgi:glyoxylase-like metal-dependent hydrolase (beta-lactamase superfamily II)